MDGRPLRRWSLMAPRNAKDGWHHPGLPARRRGAGECGYLHGEAGVDARAYRTGGQAAEEDGEEGSDMKTATIVRRELKKYQCGICERWYEESEGHSDS